MGISDLIAGFLQECLDETGDGVLEVQRGELAQRFNCVPSQINYVMSTRFSPERGYIVESRRGVSGGYFLKRPCEELSIYDVFQSIGDPPLLNRCQREGYPCENFPKGGCGVCRELCRIQEALNQELRRTPLSDIF